MTELIILCGSAEARAREIAALYDGGNRVHVAAIVADPAQTAEAPAGAWLVCDDWSAPLDPEIEARFVGHVIVLDNNRTAPEAAVDILNAIRKSEARAADTDRRWAERLGIKQTVAPPPVPAGAQRRDGVPTHPTSAPQVQPQSARVYGPNPGPQLVANAQTQHGAPDQPPMPSTYLVWAIVMTILCCLPAGIVAIIFASQVSARYYTGDYEGAMQASRRAQIWIIVSFVLGVLTQTLYMPMIIAGWV